MGSKFTTIIDWTQLLNEEANEWTGKAPKKTSGKKNSTSPYSTANPAATITKKRSQNIANADKPKRTRKTAEKPKEPVKEPEKIVPEEPEAPELPEKKKIKRIPIPKNESAADMMLRAFSAESYTTIETYQGFQ
ncbi:hypothetical protein L3Y34_006967 [Caenorhabditis briggsae]|uniref:Uncharacterized protein n=1 Tax=Caenorhabditis briggsae TaxID=6238 RepID=A0AAE8ZYN2_CAEBR|nr:hypothetical protein L3Y34_006964 [Caenorhabditis briggsae]ULT87499.1 hypothetical protein L3Y34_006967 [Caenorhabditis briggsae]